MIYYVYINVLPLPPMQRNLIIIYCTKVEIFNCKDASQAEMIIVDLKGRSSTNFNEQPKLSSLTRARS